jgi:hypothetical protein
MSKGKTKTGKQHPIKSIKRAAAPLCCFETADPASTIKGICDALNELNKGETPIAQWDCARGLTGLNDEGTNVVVTGAGNPDPQFPLDQVLNALGKITGEGNVTVFIHNAHRFITGEFVAQAVWNLRDQWKAVRNTLVLLCPAMTLPAELQQDVVLISEDAPTQDEISEVFNAVADSAGVKITDEVKLIDATLGYLSAFAVEQSAALSVIQSPDGERRFDLDKLWQLKVANLKQTAGLEVSLPKENFSDLVGCEGYKDLALKFIKGRETPRSVLHLDEIEKMTAGATGGDLSGTSQALMEQFLFWTENNHVKGILFVGVPGAGKTRAVTCTAGEAGVPHLRASMSTVKGGIVGQSEQQMKSLLKAVDAVSQGRTLLIATCNSVDALSPELMARFKLATFVFDYPTQDEAAAIWKYYCVKYGHKWTGMNTVPPNAKNWVGREIESCCERAWLFNCSLAEAAKSVVPICVSNAAKMDALRQSVSGRFLSASEMKTYAFNPNSTNQTGRRL